MSRLLQQSSRLPSPASGRGVGGEGAWNMKSNPTAASAIFLHPATAILIASRTMQIPSSPTLLPLAGEGSETPTNIQ